jgi:hypothetical protein
MVEAVDTTEKNCLLCKSGCNIGTNVKKYLCIATIILKGTKNNMNIKSWYVAMRVMVLSINNPA